jgi:hypothetical protein
VTVDLGIPRLLTHLKLYLLDDGEGQPIAAPAEIVLEYTNGDTPWQPVPLVDQSEHPLAAPAGHRPYLIRFPKLKAQKLRAIFKHATAKRSGLTEFEVWGPVTNPYSPAPPPVGNIAFNPKPKEGSFPKASASFHDRYGGIPPSAHDGKIVYRATPTNRWTCYGSPNQDTDWFALDFGEQKKFARVILHIYDDRGGVQAPRHYRLERWKDDQWQEIPNQKKSPQKPVGSAANTVLFPPVKSAKLRVVFSHLGKGHTRSGLTEIEVWSE